MDTDRQLFETEATGWQRGLYEDVKATFRAPIVNWFWRTLLANEPEFTRYLWGQVKPLFGTRAFGRFSVAYRDAVLSTLDAHDGTVPTYRPGNLGLDPAAVSELKGQAATFDVVAPRLALLFAVCDRASHGEAMGSGPDSIADTAPLPAWVDADRGRPPTMLDPDAIPAELAETVAAIQAFHGLGEDLPSVYRCFAQWPTYLERAWGDLAPIFEGEGFERAVAEAGTVVDDHVRRLPYQPQLSPEALATKGLDDERRSAVQEFFHTFANGPVETVLPALPVYAQTLDVAGDRTFQ